MTGKTNIDDVHNEIHEAAIAHMMRMKAARISDAKRHNAMEGYWQSLAPFGYDLIEGRLFPNEHAGTVRIIFEMRTMGATTGEIARHLNERAIFSPRGKNWKHTVVRYLLSNQVYVGVTIYKPWDGSDELVVKTTHTGLVSEEDFERVQALNALSRRRT